MRLTQLNPSMFENYEQHKAHLDGKILLYSDQNPRGKSLDFGGKTYNLGARQKMNLSGAVSNPARSLYKVTLSYEWDNFIKDMKGDGILFIYSGFAPSAASGSSEAAKQLNYNCYPLTT